ncbi:MAG: DUF1499 domain-containing protein [Desulfobacterales bacterium]|nr:DUF1499 domain-containing protein [Desulfobacterales bacterium]
MKLINCILMGIAGICLISGCSGKPAIGLGKNGLLPCPDKPNCVSSLATDESHSIVSLSYVGPREAAFKRLRAIVLSAGDVEIISETSDYMHATFKSKVFRFVDDVEFWFPENGGIIHVRSASRLGYSDLGVNRKRVEALRQVFEGQNK